MIFSNGVLKSQSLKAFLVAAENSFENKNYGAALKYYLAANEFKDDRYDLLYKSAESARMFNAFNLAESKYQALIEADSTNQYGLTSFWLADIKQRLGKYNEAIDLYNIYLSEHGGEDEYFMKRANKEIEACKWALGLIENPSESIKISHMDGDVNSPYSDFAGMENEHMFYYTSMRFKRKKDSNNPPRPISKILKLENDVSVSADSTLNKGVFLNAHLTYNKDKSKAYYTICDYEGVAEIRCDIYSVDTHKDGSFGQPVKLPDFINNPNSTNTQPNVGYNSVMNKEILYFVSDREGGKGKRDIYYSIIGKDGTYTRPLNLNAVNTKEDDITPFYYSNTNTLYFSSKGYMNMGGFDIYAAPFEDEDFGKPVHQGFPLNSSYDDIYYWLSDDGNLAYFSSNREGAIYLDPETEACCFDIFKVNIKPIDIDLEILTFNKRTLGELPGTTVKLFDTNTNELLGEITELGSNESHFNLLSGKNYYVVASRLGYDPDTIRFNTLGIKKTETVTKKMYLNPRDLKLKVLTFDKTTLLKLNDVELTLVNLTDKSVKPIVINKNNSNEFNFEILRGHNYQITAKRKGYQSVNSFINTNNFDGDEILKKLYLPDLLNAYLPLVVYFDNDRPDLRSRKKTTRKTYTETYTKYINREDVFVKKYTQDMSEDYMITQAKNEIESFFDYDVKAGKEKFDFFMSTLLAVLENGHHVGIQLKGYASPRADYKYNLILAQRRVNSLDNEIRKYKGGVFLQYLKSGALIITDVSYGESLAPKDISDSLKDEKHSIYGVRASKERRVEVIQIDTDLNEK